MHVQVCVLKIFLYFLLLYIFLVGQGQDSGINYNSIKFIYASGWFVRIESNGSRTANRYVKNHLRTRNT